MAAAAPSPADESVTPLALDADAETKAKTSKPRNSPCPSCLVGLLYPIAYDADATYEEQPYSREGDPKGHRHFKESGGSIRLHCFNCNRGFTKALAGDEE